MENNDVVIEVWDNGAGMTQEQIDCALNSRKGGVGLKNVDDRVKLMYGSRYGISIASEPGLYTSVFVRLPEQ